MPDGTRASLARQSRGSAALPRVKARPSLSESHMSPLDQPARGALVAAALAVVAVLMSMATLAVLVAPAEPPLAATPHEAANGDGQPAATVAYGA
jgi:hypothetical protein